MSIVGPNEDTLVPSQLLKADPNVGLQIFDQVANVDVPVRVRQRGGHKDSTLGHFSSATFPAFTGCVIVKGGGY
jgi:hypothetical protein